MPAPAVPSQRWTDRRLSWRPAGELFNPAGHAVVPLTDHLESAARAFVQRHHYAGSYPASRLAIGLTTSGPAPADAIDVDGRALVGVAVLSVPASSRVLTNVFPGLAPYQQTLDLGRFVLVDQVPGNGESWFLGRVHRLAADAGIRGLTAFSDPVARLRELVDIDPNTGIGRIRREIITPGHRGVIYQATNALALGTSTRRTVTWLPRPGLILSDRTAQKIRKQESGADGAEQTLVDLGARPRRTGEDPAAWLGDALTRLGAVQFRHPGCWRYAWAIGPGRRKVRIGMERTPYPRQDTAPVLPPLVADAATWIERLAVAA